MPPVRRAAATAPAAEDIRKTLRRMPVDFARSEGESPAKPGNEVGHEHRSEQKTCNDFDDRRLGAHIRPHALPFTSTYSRKPHKNVH